MRVGDPPVGGRYSLVEPFGADERFAGGKVQTWRAQDSLVDRAVVLRVMTPGGNSAKLFLDRALEMSLIAHPGLGMVYDAVDLGEHALVVCEWIHGTSLADTLKAHGPLTPATARKTLGDVAEAITVAHHAGLPIGGITAERVVLRDNGSVTVTGVPALFADERGDIQQLGKLLYAALTGEDPALDDPDLAKKLHRGVPRDLAVLCQRALDNDPARQLGSAAAFAAVLRPRTKPRSPTGTTAGRTSERLGGFDTDPAGSTAVPAPPPVTVLAPPSVAGPAGGPAEAEVAAPPPATVRIPLRGAAAAAAKPKMKAEPFEDDEPPTRAIPRRRSTAPAKPVVAAVANPVLDAAPPTRAIPTRRKPSKATPVTSAVAGTVLDSAATTPTVDSPPVKTNPRGQSSTAPPAAPGRGPIAAPGSTAAGTAEAEPPPAPDRLRDDWGEESRPDSVAGPRGDSPIRTTEDYDPWLDDTGTWGTYDDSDEDPDEDFDEGSQARRKILLYAVPLAALILIVLIAVFIGKQFNDALNDDAPPVVPDSQGTPGTTPGTEGTGGAAPGDPAAAPSPLPVVSAAVYNPFGDGEPEHDDEVGLAYDGDPATAWQTLTYQSTPEFGNLKPGVGVIFDLGEERSINAVELSTSLPGSAIEIRVGAAPDAPLDSYQMVGALDPFTETGAVPLAEPVRARFVIVWFVRLVEANGGFEGALAEFRVLGT